MEMMKSNDAAATADCSPASFRLPCVPGRPGTTPDFSYLDLSPAGSVERPACDAPLAEVADLSRQLIRVLDDGHDAVGPWNPRLDAATLRTGLHHMLVTRIFDERMQRVQRQGRISFYVRSLGEEAVSVAQ